MIDFFIDTADINYITNLVKVLDANNIPRKHIVGVTTNPSAFKKIGITNTSDMFKHVRELIPFVEKTRGDSDGVLYIQPPNSCLPPNDFISFAGYLQDMTQGYCVPGIKIPPYSSILEIVRILKQYASVNVTGVTDLTTANHCFNYGVDYVSILAGRMEEANLPAKNVVDEISKSNCPRKIITGSMRTLEGLRWVVEKGTTPTIGTRVWDAIIKDNAFDILTSNNNSIVLPKLSTSFFDEMNSCVS